MQNRQFIVSHAPFWHNGSKISSRSYNTVIAAIPALLLGFFHYGSPVVGVLALSISSAMIWELIMNLITRRPLTIGDGNAALTGTVFAMLLPATSPWWLVITGTFFAVVIGKQIFGGIGSNAFNPVVVAVAILMVSWKDFFDFNEALLNYDFEFIAAYPLAELKHFGTSAITSFDTVDLLMGKQTGGMGATFGLGIIIGGIYLIIRGIIRWEIPVSFLAGVFITALLFNISDPLKYANPVFHICTGYTLIGAFFLATEDSSSPVNFVPMLACGAFAGVMTVLIRNIGIYVDGVIYSILIMNLICPIIDKIRPKALGKVV